MKLGMWIYFIRLLESFREKSICVACCRGYCVDYMVGKEGKVVHYMFDTFMIICKRTVCFNILYICYKNRLVFFTKKERLAIFAL